MIPSGYLTADRVDRARAAGRLSARLAVLEARRRSAEHVVAVLLETWGESVIDQQQTGWQEMDDAARDVIDALSALLGAVDLARGEADVSPPAPRSAP